MAAALYAFDHHADQFERVAGKVPPQYDVGPVIDRVVAGEESVETVLRDLEDDDSEDEDTTAHEPRELTDDEKEIKRLNARIERLSPRRRPQLGLLRSRPLSEKTNSRRRPAARAGARSEKTAR